MNTWFQGLLTAISMWLLNNYRRLSVELVKIEAAIWYVKGVRQARQSFIAILRLVFFIVLFSTGMVVFHIGLYSILPEGIWRGIILLALGLIYIIVSIVVIRNLCSEKHWMRWTNADRFIDQVTRKRQ